MAEKEDAEKTTLDKHSITVTCPFDLIGQAILPVSCMIGLDWNVSQYFCTPGSIDLDQNSLQDCILNKFRLVVVNFYWSISSRSTGSIDADQTQVKSLQDCIENEICANYDKFPLDQRIET